MGASEYNELIKKVEYPDSIEINPGTKGIGKSKLYYNADNKDKAQERMKVALELTEKFYTKYSELQDKLKGDGGK